MERIETPERPDWREQAAALGFHFHSIGGQPYWDESAHYRFSLAEIENDIERPTAELHELAKDLVSRAVRDESYLRRLAIPVGQWDFIRDSWLRGDPHLYGRMDFAYDGRGPAKLYELNYDTPTALYEAAVFQWVWLEQMIERGALPRGTDQFNSLQEKLLLTFAALAPHVGGTMHFASVRGSQEDRATVDYLADLAFQSGIHPRYVAIEDVGRTAEGRFTDAENRIIETIFKLYPWEMMFADEFAPSLATSRTTWIEPPWKAILSNKGTLALLWELHPGHPHLLPAHFEESPSSALPPGWVRKPLCSREGANVEITTAAGERFATAGPYADLPYVRQAFYALPRFAGRYALVGSWMVADLPAGIGMREDDSLITRDSARFVPHVIAA